MVLIQLTGLSGAGKTTLATSVKEQLALLGYAVEVIDGDVYRNSLCKDLGFSKEDRCENVRRLFIVGQLLVKHKVIVLMAIINPYQAIRQELRQHDFVRTVYLDCTIENLIRRDPKGLYTRALLPEGNPNKIKYFTGISAPYEVPLHADLVVKTDKDSIEVSTHKLLTYILNTVKNNNIQGYTEGSLLKADANL